MESISSILSNALLVGMFIVKFDPFSIIARTPGLEIKREFTIENSGLERICDRVVMEEESLAIMDATEVLTILCVLVLFLLPQQPIILLKGY
jgi:hypothetical protein